MKNQKGFMPVIIGVVVVAVVGIVGYLLIAKNKAPGKGILSNIQLPGGVGLNANCELNDAQLCRFMDKSIKMADSYNTGFVGTSVSTDKSGKKMENRWEMAEDKSHFVTYENGKEQSNMIMIGDTTYTKDLTDGKWTKFTFKSTIGKEGKGLFDVEEMKNKFKDTAKEMKDKTTYKALGKEACGSLQCFKYQIINPLVADLREYIYFDDREYVMRKMRVEMEGNITETSFEFKTVSISEPSPIKESPASGFNPDMLNKLQKEQGADSSIDTSKIQEEIQKYMNQSSSSDSSESLGEGE